MTNIDDALDAATASNTDEAVLGLDIGGTSIKMGVVTRDGKILATTKVPTGELDNAEAFDRVSTSAVALVREAAITLHIRLLTGKNTHHIIEGIFKAVARALREACEIDPAAAGEIPSTKGTLGGDAP